VWAVKEITVRNVSYAKTAWKLYAHAVTDARNVPLSAPTAVKNAKTVRTAVFAANAASVSIAWAVKVTTATDATNASTVWARFAPAVPRDARNARSFVRNATISV